MPSKQGLIDQSYLLGRHDKNIYLRFALQKPNYVRYTLTGLIFKMLYKNTCLCKY